MTHRTSLCRGACTCGVSTLILSSMIIWQHMQAHICMIVVLQLYGLMQARVNIIIIMGLFWLRFYSLMRPIFRVFSAITIRSGLTPSACLNRRAVGPSIRSLPCCSHVGFSNLCSTAFCGSNFPPGVIVSVLLGSLLSRELRSLESNLCAMGC